MKRRTPSTLSACILRIDRGHVDDVAVGLPQQAPLRLEPFELAADRLARPAGDLHQVAQPHRPQLGLRIGHPAVRTQHAGGAGTGRHQVRHVQVGDGAEQDHRLDVVVEMPGRTDDLVHDESVHRERHQAEGSPVCWRRAFAVDARLARQARRSQVFCGKFSCGMIGLVGHTGPPNRLWRRRGDLRVTNIHWTTL